MEETSGSTWKKPAAAAQYYGVSRKTIYNWIPLGLPVVKINGTTLVDIPRSNKWLRTNYSVKPKSQELVEQIIQEKGL